MTNRFFVREVPSQEFITYSDLADVVGVDVGTLINGQEGWLEFKDRGKTIMVPKKDVRQSVQWTQLMRLECVDSSNRIIIINNEEYQVRLLSGYFVPRIGELRSEYDRFLMDMVGDEKHPYTREDLGLDTDHVIWTRMYERRSDPRFTGYVQRGSNDISITSLRIDQANVRFAWRPCLEKI